MISTTVSPAILDMDRQGREQLSKAVNGMRNSGLISKSTKIYLTFQNVTVHKAIFTKKIKVTFEANLFITRGNNVLYNEHTVFNIITSTEYFKYEEIEKVVSANMNTNNIHVANNVLL